MGKINLNKNDIVSGNSELISTTQSHMHDTAQLSYAVGDVMYVIIDDYSYIVPPNMGIYIPAQTDHRADMNKKIKVQSIRFEGDLFKLLPQNVQLIHLSELAQQIINKLCIKLEGQTKNNIVSNLLAVLLDEIHSSKHYDYAIKIPKEPHLYKVYTLFKNSLDYYPSLVVAADHVHINSRTLTRLFIKNTGMSFVTWKQQFIFVRSIELLYKYKQTKSVAYALGYNSESAFIAMFKKMSGGKVPSNYFR